MSPCAHEPRSTLAILVRRKDETLAQSLTRLIWPSPAPGQKTSLQKRLTQPQTRGARNSLRLSSSRRWEAMRSEGLQLMPV